MTPKTSERRIAGSLRKTSIAVCCLLFPLQQTLSGPLAPAAGGNAVTLKAPEDFDAIQDRERRSVALFQEMGKVIQHPRCLNCHVAGDRPRQGDEMRPHIPYVRRGASGMGASGLYCTTCHGPANFDPAEVPGNPQWSLAPVEMAWENRTLGEICVQLKDKARNGNRGIAELTQHMASDPLVGWGWHPGKGRTPAPGTQEQFGALFKAWVATGAVCPR